MTGTPLGALLAALAALLACGAGLALARARTRADMATAFAAAGGFAAFAALVAGGVAAGGAMLAACVALTVFGYAAAAHLGAPRASEERHAVLLSVLGAGVLLGVAAWRWAPAAAPAAPVPTTPAFDAPDGGTLILALALLVGVAGVASALLGRGDRGILGVGRSTGRGDGA